MERFVYAKIHYHILKREINKYVPDAKDKLISMLLDESTYNNGNKLIRGLVNNEKTELTLNEYDLVLFKEHFTIIPTNNNCIKCDRTSLHTHLNHIDISCGYGSEYDGDSLVGYLCDNCIAIAFKDDIEDFRG